jgi:hypothetical protein
MASAAKITQFSLLSGFLPGPVRIVISDHTDEAHAHVWLSLRLNSPSPRNRSVQIAQAEALELAHLIIGEEIRVLRNLKEG